ncbi:NAD(P)/FAD-dependent oxidoreductase [Phormidium yuhuli AB48]|uniref:NAD(P)/FAD-dependent oxidoreductase n=1 Tax=Phormidium yuhuli AB48 TaxID=2940671 RepID=A0ABY5AJF1_9CYAN|nr:NAD(P)/FAD-dependent oxidoreductase [Phormidium yuhuli]USR89329.1 NAD(P)/FAD-dependent oxidoreductase [Phormidium yuhuli AB48]
MTDAQNRICILGGGFGGLYTALKLAQFPWESSMQPEILLIDRSDRFVFAPLLYELVTDELQSWEIAPPFVELLANTSIQFRQADVEDINPETQQVSLVGGDRLNTDRLVLALGGETPLNDIPGVADHAIPFRTVSDAYQVRQRLQNLEASDADKIRIAIVGGGYSGVEIACKLADRLGNRGRIRIVERNDTVLRHSPEFNRNAGQRALSDRGIWTDLETDVVSLSENSISLRYRGQIDEIPVDLVLWTVGTQVAPVVKKLPVPRGDRGKIQVNSHLQVIDHPHIFALGDLADLHDAEGQTIPATAQAAFQQADYTAWNLWASLTHRPLLPFRYQNLGEMMTLGIDNATLSGLGLSLDGPLAHIARRLIYLYRLPTLEHQVKVGFNWMLDPLRAFLTPQ